MMLSGDNASRQPREEAFSPKPTPAWQEQQLQEAIKQGLGKGVITKDPRPEATSDGEVERRMPIPALVSLPDTIQTEKWKINRVFYWLAFTSGTCLITVAIVPEVRVMALGIWLGSIGLAKFLLRRAYRAK